jgi:8-oxo-dGTP pyrophosphatase MutT (NUDIX family)
VARRGPVSPRSARTAAKAPSEPLVRAAGGAVWRSENGSIAVVLVHRPRYDDWGLPKGKADPGEDDLACALREVEEETALRCEPGPLLATVRYRDQRDRPKESRYFALRPISGGAREPDKEIDEVIWLDIDKARSKLTYERDHAVLDALQRFLGGSSPP